MQKRRRPPLIRPFRWWTTVELAKLRELAPDHSRQVIAIRLGRTERAITEAAKVYGIKLTGPRSNDWPRDTVRRARQLRGERVPLRRIVEATGVPFGTLKKWLYDGRRANG